MHANTGAIVAAPAPLLRNDGESEHRPQRRRAAPPGRPAQRFGIASGTSAGRAGWWAEEVGHVLGPVAVHLEEPERFTGEIAPGDCGYVRTCTLDASPHRIRVGGRPADRDRRHAFVLVLASGSGLLSQNGRRTLLEPGDTALFAACGGLTLTFPEPSRVHLLRLPRLVLPVPQGDVSSVLAAPVRPPAGLSAVASPFLSAVARSAAHWPGSVRDRMAGHVADMLGTLIAEHAVGVRTPTASAATESGRLAGTGTQGGTAATRDLASRIRTHISLHLSDPELSPGSIAAAHHVSVRHVHWLFSQEGVTVGGWIRERRLAEAARELARPGRGDAVAVIAGRWGFVSASHFSRVFRSRYGMSPRAWRDSCAAARDPLPAAG
ncbi:helix-turn-helix domain-containing protein [Streptomyces sp. HNM0645]|uniref:helix-turn-helix domain-containing protein n=1 Tax=Streptomyces sp. HNM0645 TaxID=2782343 RepID=UPI0024B67498|nr:helix-turn-helix domain-containing protein [Streptomyces sp. HNM0645]MDI9883715.1 helix-turn-helix domain-containing protein [Streptomyces sp. HNM0645]